MHSLYSPLDRYFIGSFAFSGEIFTKGPLDREAKAVYELTIEVRDQGNPPRSSKTTVRVLITDVNDNAPVIVEPEESVVSVREELPAGTEVVRIRAIDTDEGNNASITYALVNGTGLHSIVSCNTWKLNIVVRYRPLYQKRTILHCPIVCFS